MKFVRLFRPPAPIAELHVELDGDAVVVALVPRHPEGEVVAAAASHDFPLAREDAFRGSIVRWLSGQANRTQFDHATVESIADQIVGEFATLLPED